MIEPLIDGIGVRRNGMIYSYAYIIKRAVRPFVKTLQNALSATEQTSFCIRIVTIHACSPYHRISSAMNYSCSKRICRFTLMHCAIIIQIYKLTQRLLPSDAMRYKFGNKYHKIRIMKS